MVPANQEVDILFKRSRLLLAAGSVVLASSLALGFSTASFASTASKTPSVKFKGAISCSLTGSVKISPPLTATATKVKITIAGKLTHCKGKTMQKKVKIKFGHFMGVSRADASCSDLLTGLPKLAGKVTWTTKGGHAKPTNFVYTNGSLTSQSPVTFGYPGTGGSGKATGSFAGTSTLQVVIKQTGTSILGACAGNGVKALTVKAGSFKA